MIIFVERLADTLTTLQTRRPCNSHRGLGNSRNHHGSWSIELADVQNYQLRIHVMHLLWIFIHEIIYFKIWFIYIHIVIRTALSYRISVIRESCSYYYDYVCVLGIEIGMEKLCKVILWQRLRGVRKIRVRRANNVRYWAKPEVNVSRPQSRVCSCA